MNISSNLIRFPVPTDNPVQPERTEQEPAQIVSFPVPEREDISFTEMQERGQVFAAHRIVARVADQLEAVAVL